MLNEAVSLLMGGISSLYLGYAIRDAIAVIQERKLVKRIRQALIEEVAAGMKRAELSGSIKWRMGRIEELCKQQVDLTSSINVPSKNAMHSKHKWTILASIKDLERTKLDLMRSVVADGIDLTVVVTDANGGKETLKMSELIIKGEVFLNEKPEAPVKIEPKRKFKLIEGDKHDAHDAEVPGAGSKKE